MTYQRTIEFEEAAEPLVDFLCRFSTTNEIHQYVLADLYDLINDRREFLIRSYKKRLAILQSMKNIPVEELKQKSFVISRNIRLLGGE